MYKVEIFKNPIEGEILSKKICRFCFREFRPLFNRQLDCLGCKIIVQCGECSIDFELNAKNKHRLSEQLFCSYKCSNTARNKSIICLVHGEQEKSLSGKCMKCMNHRKGTEPKFCINCCKETSHIGSRCKICKSWITPGGLGAPYAWGLMNYCEKHPKEKRNFNFNNISKCWGCIKESITLEGQEVLFNGLWQSTYRKTYNSSLGQSAMEAELVDKKIGWFAYIKGYLDYSNKWIPLVVGKTGSKLVQSSGTDIRFLVNGDKPARIFLQELNLIWDTSKIIVIPTVDKSSALELERFIQKKYNLFLS